MFNGCTRHLVVDRALSTRHLVVNQALSRKACDPGPKDGNSTFECSKHDWLNSEFHGVVESTGKTHQRLAMLRYNG
jgi:hypothetical protein